MFRRGRRRAHEAAARAIDPVVVAVTTPLTAEVAGSLAVQVDRLSSDTPVVIDVTAIPAFDSDGATALASLQERFGADQVTIVGFRQAAARLTGAVHLGEHATAPVGSPRDGTDQGGWVIRRLRNLVVVQCDDDAVASTDDLEGPLALALEADVAIVVVDLRDLRLTARGTDALAFASSAAALCGQELLVVNVDTEGAETLQLAGLSATTYVAPET